MKKIIFVFLVLFSCTWAMEKRKIDAVFAKLEQIEIGMDQAQVEEIFYGSSEYRISEYVCDRTYYNAGDYTSTTFYVGYYSYDYGYNCKTVAVITCINGKVDSIFYP